MTFPFNPVQVSDGSEIFRANGQVNNDEEEKKKKEQQEKAKKEAEKLDKLANDVIESNSGD